MDQSSFESVPSSQAQSKTIHFRATDRRYIDRGRTRDDFSVVLNQHENAATVIAVVVYDDASAQFDILWTMLV
jgi:hypothetical protein